MRRISERSIHTAFKEAFGHAPTKIVHGREGWYAYRGDSLFEALPHGHSSGFASQFPHARGIAFVHLGTIRRKNPIRTQEGRVLRTEGHNRRESSDLLLLRKKEKKQHKRRTRRIGRLSYQTAEYVLHYGPRGGKRGGKRAAPAKRKSAAFEGDLWDYLGNTFGR